ncbi:hypothetical protein QTP88_020175 [Uroleucon formosanum]
MKKLQPIINWSLDYFDNVKIECVITDWLSSQRKINFVTKPSRTDCILLMLVLLKMYYLSNLISPYNLSFSITDPKYVFVRQSEENVVSAVEVVTVNWYNANNFDQYFFIFK